MSNPFTQMSTSIYDVLVEQVGGEVRLGPPGRQDQADPADPVVDIHLLGMTAGPRHAMAEDRPVQLEYLVSVLAEESATAGLLYDVCHAIEQSPDHDLSPDPVPLDWWSAFGVQPRVGVRVTASSRIDTPFETAPLVTEPVILRSEVKPTRHQQEQRQQALPSTARKG